MCRNQVFFILASNSRSKKKKTLPEHPCIDSDKKETCVTFQQTILNSRVVGARQSYQVFRKNTWFLKKQNFFMGFLYVSQLLYGISYYLISIIKL